jgi:hypothetical protein
MAEGAPRGNMRDGVNKALRAAFVLVALVAASSPWHAAGAQEAAPVVVLRGFFVAVAAKDYAPAWSAFSAKTQGWVAQSIAGSANMTAAEVRKLLDSNDDRVQRGFWDSFRESSKPELFTQLAMSPAAAAGADGAVKLTVNGQQMTFLMYQEAGGWKLGWMETFFPGGKLPAKK